jgi:hypothetical protein
VRSPLIKERERITTLLFYAAVLLLGYLVVRIFAPFFVPLAWAAVLAIFVYPSHEKVAARYGTTRAALISTIAVTLVIIGPGLAGLRPGKSCRALGSGSRGARWPVCVARAGMGTDSRADSRSTDD